MSLVRGFGHISDSVGSGRQARVCTHGGLGLIEIAAGLPSRCAKSMRTGVERMAKTDIQGGTIALMNRLHRPDLSIHELWRADEGSDAHLLSRWAEWTCGG